MSKRCVIVANGQLYPEIITEITSDDYIIGVDRAAYWLLSEGIIPDLAIGDFDSVTSAEMAIISKKSKRVEGFIAEKDWTDTELALEHALDMNSSMVVLYGGSGTRMDHMLGVLFLLERAEKRGIRAVFRNTTNEIQVLARGRTILTKREGYRYISVIPVTDSITISLSDFKYTLKKQKIRRGQTIGISNEFIGMTAVVTLHAGTAFAVQSKD